MLPYSTVFCSILLAGSSLFAQTAGAVPQALPEDPERFLLLATSQNDIDGEGVTPWELKATFQLFDQKGALTQTLSLDETWEGPKEQRLTWTGDSFNQTIIVNHNGTFRSGSPQPVPAIIESALRTIVHPVPDSKEIATADITMQQEKFGKFRFNCVASMLRSPPPTVLPGGVILIPRPIQYCFDVGTANYRFTLNGDMMLQSNATAAFQNRHVVMQDSVTIGKVVRAKGAVDDLHPIPQPDPQTFVPATDAVKEGVVTVASPSEFKTGQLIHKVDPIIPASFGGLKETVALHAIIDKNGHVVSVQMIGTPNSDLAIAASNAVKQWIYEPFTLNGKPVKTGTTVVITFGQ